MLHVGRARVWRGSSQQPRRSSSHQPQRCSSGSQSGSGKCLAAAEGGIVKVHVKKVESHGKAGATDGNGNVPTFALKSAIESGALLHPGTRDLVLFLADHRRAPSVAQEAKDGWGAATKYFWGYMDTAKFSKRAVPDCEARGWSCHDQHVYVGLCADRQRRTSRARWAAAHRADVLRVCALLDAGL